ncbi:FadR/GntR family transcriptional regulator [Clavibacter sepedonicus]|nr:MULTISPECIES: FCD domain-containing protein [Clavibacter]UUK65612.1 FCD domain-containing protein [Clavibacter sepedonicus]
MALLVLNRRVGAVVQGPGRWNVYDPRIICCRLNGPGRSDHFRSLTQLPRAAEPVSASLAARHASAAQRTRIAELAVDLRHLDFLAVDIECHHLILEASGNDMFCALREAITEIHTGRTHQRRMPRMPRRHALKTHEQAADAARNGESAGAEMMSLLARSAEHSNKELFPMAALSHAPSWGLQANNGAVKPITHAAVRKPPILATKAEN